MALTDAEKSARWRARHPNRARDVNIRAKERVRRRVSEYKAGLGCECCRITDPRVLDLHHRKSADKILAVSQMIYLTGWSSVVAEMEKCRVLCANCHRLEHTHEAQADITAQIATAGFYRAVSTT